MAVWPQKSMRPTAPCRPPAAADDRRSGKARMAAGRPPRRIDRNGSAPRSMNRPESPSNGSRRPRVPGTGRRNPVSSLFRTDSRSFLHEIGSSGCLQPVSGLLQSASAFGIALPLTASDRRHLGCGCSSVVEHDLAKVGVEGSSPFARSNFSKWQCTGSNRRAAYWRPRRLCPGFGPPPLISGCDRPRPSPCPSSRCETGLETLR
jgi:hypothetical protein